MSLLVVLLQQQQTNQTHIDTSSSKTAKAKAKASSSLSSSSSDQNTKNGDHLNHSDDDDDDDDDDNNSLIFDTDDNTDVDYNNQPSSSNSTATPSLQSSSLNAFYQQHQQQSNNNNNNNNNSINFNTFNNDITRSLKKLNHLSLEKDSNTPLECVCSFDTTGRMYKFFEEFRSKSSTTLESLFQTIPQLKIAFIVHGDYCDDVNQKQQQSSSTNNILNRAIAMLSFTNDRMEIMKWLERVRGTNGGDAPENYELVLRKSRELPWSENSKKAVFIFGDDVPHPPSYTNQHFYWRNELYFLSKIGVKVYGIQCQNNKHAQLFYEELAGLSGGRYVHLKEAKHIAQFFETNTSLNFVIPPPQLSPTQQTHTNGLSSMINGIKQRSSPSATTATSSSKLTSTSTNINYYASPINSSSIYTSPIAVNYNQAIVTPHHNYYVSPSPVSPSSSSSNVSSLFSPTTTTFSPFSLATHLPTASRLNFANKQATIGVSPSLYNKKRKSVTKEDEDQNITNLKHFAHYHPYSRQPINSINSSSSLPSPTAASPTTKKKSSKATTTTTCPSEKNLFPILIQQQQEHEKKQQETITTEIASTSSSGKLENQFLVDIIDSNSVQVQSFKNNNDMDMDIDHHLTYHHHHHHGITLPQQ
ncbi:hypothetical protein DFA_05024 [Cavenderia fasciculata]|uniref:VWFA domain-containing protein n=1 Tax=Cavenderia fasciculata TaxID=261658 RepID=F4PN01_CACFS|nr:uncharacterized protein DFA_05024 [Cavenderia fasciculata]EGG22894.1 hypothetical protein DFA_05024 [Cavenderia fasciculata]|eukprot:XP_004360745.1 hypothetical protein DFA_05024 [Cavenderia fasciculata]